MINPGSSPRVRGKLVAVDQADDRVRIIPARAGQTNRVRTYNRHTADHPRACGANALAGDPHNWKDGSSPRVRGKRLPWRSGTGRISDHPRACGANGIECAHRTCRHGSSPRVRGKRRLLQRRRGPGRIIPARAGQTTPVRLFTPRGGRIIPARAGQTSARDMSRNAYADHPRACGANATTAINVSGAAGSSPRVRGKLDAEFPHEVRGRIIPARAGQTSGSLRSLISRPDHPRACGANSFPQLVLQRVAGSSPRVRGKLRRGCGEDGRRRIIPARAGQTVRYLTQMRSSPDHPRACGANPHSRLIAA